MRSYHHLTAEERESLMLFQHQGQSIRQIAKQLGRSPSTISRDLQRNLTPYRASITKKVGLRSMDAKTCL